MLTTSLADPAYWAKKRVVVTGGTGFVGSHLVERLKPLCGSIVVPTRQTAFPAHLAAIGQGCEVHTGDLHDASFAKTVFEGADIAILLAATVGGIEYNINHPASIFRDSMGVFLPCMDAAREKKVARVLVTSSACVYPHVCTIPTPEREGTIDRPEPTNEGYGWAKRMQEFLAEKYVEEFGMSICVARPYNAYGPRDNFAPEASHVIPALIRKAFDPKEDTVVVWGSGKQSRSFLYVDDFVDGLIRICERASNAMPTNLGADDETTIAKVASLVVELSGTGKKLAFDTTKPEGQPRRRCDTTKLGREYDFATRIQVRRGIEETIAYYREHVLPYEKH